MDNNSLKNKAITGAFWRMGADGFSKIVNFVISIILARLLLPEDYGIIALVSVFVVICDKIVVSGLATSLIQKKDADNKDFSTIFYFSLGVSIVLYVVLFFTAPFIADFYGSYDRELLVSVIRVMSLQLITGAVNSVQSAYVSRNLKFKCFFWSSMGSALISGVVGIYMAYIGYGVWSLVAQYLLKEVGTLTVLWITAKWRPSLDFSFERFKSLYSYGWKIFSASMIKTLYNDLRSLVIGKFYSPESLAFYNKGQSFPQLVESSVSGTIDSVFFPTISKKQSSKIEMLSMLRRTIKISTYILTPLLVGLAATATSLITVLLTEKWLDSVFYLQIISFSFVFVPIEIENLQSIKAIGRSDLVLKLEIIKRILGIIFLIFAMPFGVKMISVSLLVSNILSAVINALPNKKLFSYNYREQIFDILPSFIMSLLMYLIVYPISYLSLSPIFILLIQIVVGIVVYLLLSIVMRNDNFFYILKTIKGFIKGKIN